MRQLESVLGQPSGRAMAEALVHFLWQGTLVALLLAAVQAVLGRRSARARYAAACAALAVMLSLPAATAWRLNVARATDPARSSPVSASVPSPEIGGATRTLAPLPTGSIGSLAPWILLTWLAGVSFFSIRFLGGCLVAQGLRRRGTRSPGDRWEQRLSALAARLGITRTVRLLESAAVSVPTAVGILRPVVLLPLGTLTGIGSGQLEALMAHELAHIRRADCLVNLFQALAETLLFYHPAVWWVSSRIRVERENICDDLAVAVTGDPAAYARALVDLAERRNAAPRLAVAADGGQLWNRIARLSGDREGAGNRSPRWPAAVVALGGVLALGVAAQVPFPATPGSAGGAANRTPAVPSRAESATAPQPAPRAGGAEESAQTRNPSQPPPAPRALLSPEQLVAFRIHGVTPEFIGEIVALGYDRSSPEELVALRIHGVTPDYIAWMTKIFGKRPLEEYTELRIHGLTPDSAEALQSSFGKLSLEDAVSLRIHGVDGAYAKAFRDAGYAALSAEEAVSLRIHGVDAADASAWSKAGFPSPSIDDLVSLRIHGATPEFAAEMRALGLTDLSLDDLVSLRIHGVTPEFVREIHALGYASLSADDLTAFRIHGVTPDGIRAANREAGGQLSADELIDRRIHRHGTDRPVEEEP